MYAEGDVTFAQAVGKVLVGRGWKLAAAESCTGGLVGELLTARGGSSEFFLGSAVTYDDRIKTSLLGVPPEMLSAHGAVSREVARAMAEGALARFEADIALGITGIAGPGGATPDKPVGLVHYAVATHGGITDKQLVFPGDRDIVRLRAAYAALGLALRIARAGVHDEPNRA